MRLKAEKPRNEIVEPFGRAALQSCANGLFRHAGPAREIGQGAPLLANCRLDVFRVPIARVDLPYVRHVDVCNVR